MPGGAPLTKKAQGNAMNGTLTVSAAGLKLIQSFEGCEKPVKGKRGRYRAYVDPVGILTIGWGHTNATGRAFDADTVWTQAECDAALAEDLAKFEAGVRALVKVALSQCQFDALVSFAYNCGLGNLRSSTLLRKVNKGDFAAAAREFAKWNKAGGRVLAGLTRRRAAEAMLFQDAGCVEVAARERHAMPQAVDAPAQIGLTETVANSRIAKAGLTAAAGDGYVTAEAIGDAAEKARAAKQGAEDLGLWDVMVHAAQSPKVWIGLAVLFVIAAVIFWRHQDNN
jgi:lysozyme